MFESSSLVSICSDRRQLATLVLAQDKGFNYGSTPKVKPEDTSGLYTLT